MNDNTNHADDATVSGQVKEEPSARKEPSADKEPSANQEPSADKKPTANTAQSTREQESLTFLELLQSMWAGLIGVQSGKNRERDFEKGKPIQFIIAGVVTTLIFLALFITLAIKVSS